MDSVGEGEGGNIWEKKKISFQGLFHIVIFETKLCTDFSVIKFNFRLTTPALVSSMLNMMTFLTLWSTY